MATTDDSTPPVSRGSILIDRTGHRYGSWFVLERVRGKPTKWLCRCDCGTVRPVLAQSLKSGKSVCCGCLGVERMRQLRFKGMAPYYGTPEHHAWTGAKQRCYYPGHIEFHRYGGRGITMAPKWREDFFRFLADMGPCPPGHQLDRYPDADGPYAPGNCRGATRHDQMRNHSRNIWVEYQGQHMILQDVAVVVGVDYHRLHSFYRRRQMPLEIAIAKARTPAQKRPGNMTRHRHG